MKKVQKLEHRERRPYNRAPRKKAKVKKWGINGEGVAFNNRQAIFIEGAIPEEVVEYEITQRKPGFSQARLKRIIEPSPRRRVPMCEYAEICGGCSVMHVDYRGQMQMKRNVLADALEKYAGYRGPIEPILKNPSPLGYRNAIKMPFGLNKEGHVQSGMYQRNSNDFVALDHCLIHSPKLEKVRKEIDEILSRYELSVDPKARKSGLITLVLKEFNDEVYVVLVTSDMELDQQLQEEILNLEDVAGLWQNIKKASDPEYEVFGEVMKHLGGQMEIALDLDDLSLSLTPRSFFQLNTAQALVLYRTVAQWLKGSKRVVELYCGIGAISLFIADEVEEVIGIELIEDAVANARQNALMNAKGNVTFICGDAGKEFKKIVKKIRPDAIVVDPPRRGLDDLMKKELLRSGAEKIVYVSCNPSTLGKDLAVLQEKYRIEKVQPLDMFSQTPHIETIVLLSRIEN